jgi:antitoxin (DNA-binding transcriptional repressor) of toxin-antitoxin stability system
MEAALVSERHYYRSLYKGPRGLPAGYPCVRDSVHHGRACCGCSLSWPSAASTRTTWVTAGSSRLSCTPGGQPLFSSSERIAAMIEDGMTLRITEAELARDVRAVLAKVEQGSEVIIELEDHRPVAVISAPHRSGRPITEILEEARQRNSTVTLDENFGRDLEEIIASHQQPWHPPSWD